MIDVPTLAKRCSKCQKTKPLSEFYQNKQVQDGRRPQCKACDKARAATYYVAHRKEIAIHKATYYKKHNATREVTMLYCPRDPELGVPMYLWPCKFPRIDFQETLAAGYWPDGSVFQYAAEHNGEVIKWKVKGRSLHEIDGQRVAYAELKPNGYVRAGLVNEPHLKKRAE